MTDEINKGCEFQSDCIEYKDISYLKIMPICAIHELSIACHDKVNKCKYYKLYKQLKRLEQELKWANDEEKYLKDCCIKAWKELEKHSFKWDGKEKNLVVQALQLNQLYEKLEQENKELLEARNHFMVVNLKYFNALEEIREIVNQSCDNCKYNKDGITCSIGDCGEGKLKIIENRINEVLNLS